MKIEKIVNGYLEENCYIVHNNKNALIVDPGSDKNKVIKKINELNVNVVGFLITHYHFDHVEVLDELNQLYNTKIYDYKSNKRIKIYDFENEIIRNYGHTLDSVSFLFKKEKIMFTGDFVFRETIGNYEFENEEIMFSSLREFIKLDKNIVIYPGHGEKSSVGHEIENSLYLRNL